MCNEQKKNVKKCILVCVFCAFCFVFDLVLDGMNKLFLFFIVFYILFLNKKAFILGFIHTFFILVLLKNKNDELNLYLFIFL